MALKYTAENSIVTVLSSGLDALADGALAVSSALSNDDAAEREIWAEFEVYVAEQASARSSATLELLILPTVDGTNYPDAVYGATADNYSVKTWNLDAAVTARYLTVTDIKLPPGDYKVAIVNDTGYALAATGSTVKMKTYSYENVT